MVTSTCSKCGRMAYSSDSVQIEERLFHKRCFKCQTCSKALTLSNFGVFRGAVYCKHHLTLLHSNQGQKSLPLTRDRDLRSASVAFTASSAAAAASSGSKPGHRRTSITSNATSMTSPALSSNVGGGGGHLHSPSMALPSPKAGAKSASVAARIRSPSMVIRSRTNVCVICSKAAYPTESIKVDTLWYHKRCFKCEHCKCRLTMGGFAMINTNAYCKPHFKQLFQSSGGKYDRAFGSIWNNSSDPRARNNTVIRKSYVPPVESIFDGANGPPAPSSALPPTPNEKAKPKLKAVNATTPKAKAQPAKAATMTAPLVSSASSPSLLSPAKKLPAAPSAAAANSKPKLTVHNASNTSPAATVTAKQTTKPAAVKKTPVKAPPSPYETQNNHVAKATAAKPTKAALAGPAKVLPPAPTIKAPAEPSVKVVAKQPAAVAAVAASSSPATPKMNGAEDPVAAFFRALKSNNANSVGVALATLRKSKKLGLLVTPASQLTTMTPVEYAYVTGKIPLARQLVGALKEHFDSN